MKHIKQVGKNNCGQACIAMVHGYTEDEIVRYMKHVGRTSYADLARTLQQLGYGLKHVSLRGKDRTPPDFGIVLIKHNANKSWAHWIVVKNRVVYDPSESGPAPIAVYNAREFKGWRYVGYLEIRKTP